MESRLSPLQNRVLHALAGGGWTLTGGAALAGFYLGHRETRDLDLFWHQTLSLGDRPREAEAALLRAGLTVERLQTGEAFVRIRVTDGVDVLPIDLVADPVAQVDRPREVAPGIWADSPHEILVNKLTALLSRWAVRDLVDVRALVDAGGDLAQALRDAPKKDGGFSPQQLAWVLETTPAPMDPALRTFRDTLVARLLS